MIKNFCPESSWKKSIPILTHSPAGTSCGHKVSTGIRSFCVSIAVLVSWLLENAAKDIASTRRSSLISVLFALEGKWLSASVSNISLPGQYIMTMSYCCNLNNILCSLTGAEIRFLRQIISNGLWSLSTTNDLLYRYVWNFSGQIRWLAALVPCSCILFWCLLSSYLRKLWVYCLVRYRLLDLSVMHHTVKSLVCFCHNTVMVRVTSFQANLLFSGNCRLHFGPMQRVLLLQQDS